MVQVDSGSTHSSLGVYATAGYTLSFLHPALSFSVLGDKTHELGHAFGLEHDFRKHHSL